MLEGSVITHPVSGELPGLGDRLASLREALEANTQRLRDARERLQDTQQVLRAGRSRRQQLHDLAFARLLAQLETMPVIEQAKGILMAQTGCTPEAAFDMLRRASQRSNVRVSDLAGTIVARTAGGRHPGRPRRGAAAPGQPASEDGRRRPAARPNPGPPVGSAPDRRRR